MEREDKQERGRNTEIREIEENEHVEEETFIFEQEEYHCGRTLVA